MRYGIYLFALALFLPAAPAAAQVLDSIEFDRTPETTIRVNFSIPVRYEKHFPSATGETLLVYVRPLRLGEADRVGIRERKSMTGTPSSEVPLIDVTYEVNGTEGPRVVFKFARPVSYRVRQGRDNRSIEVTLLKPEKAAAEKKIFAVTLLSGFEPVGDVDVATQALKDIPQTVVYQTEAELFGKTVYFLRLGFFDSLEQAHAVRDRLVTRYPRAAVAEVTAAERERALAAPAKQAPPGPPKPVPAPKPTPRSDIAYVLNLDSSLDPALPVRALPEAYSAYRLYRTATRQNGKVWHRLRLGFFRTKAEAEQARQALKSLYPNAWIDIADAQERAESAKQTVRPPAPAPSPPGAREDVESLMAAGRAALSGGRPADAIRAFTRVLELPGHRQAPDALELLGVARERNNQVDLARVEYKLYLKLYPEGEGADRVRQRLANLEPGAPVELRAPKRREKEGAAEVFGTLSQQYYRGNTKIDTTTKTGPMVGEQDTLSLTDQNALVSILDLNARYRNGRYDNRFVVSMDHIHDTLNDEDEGRVRSAYGEIRNREAGYSARLGRQPSTSGGVLTRFDGGLFSYSVTSRLGVNLVAGVPVDDFAEEADRTFYGVSTDIGGPSLSTNLYYFHQQVDGITDREAVGTELRYFKDSGSLFALIDYEISYKELNIFLLQGHWQAPGGTTYNVLVDYRKAPPLQTTNALIGEPFDSIEALLDVRTEEQIRADAVDRTTEAKVFSVGLLHPYTPRLQLGLDITLTNVSGLPASGTMPETEGTGNVITYAGKAIASALLFASDVTVAGLAYTTSDAFDASSLAFTHRVPFSRWRIDTALRLYWQDNANGTDFDRITPAIKVDYLVRRDLALEFEFGQERTTTRGLTQDEESTRDYVILGYRWDF